MILIDYFLYDFGGEFILDVFIEVGGSVVSRRLRWSGLFVIFTRSEHDLIDAMHIPLRLLVHLAKSINLN
jgi:hypothetical protein